MPSNPARRPIWEADCALLHATLVLSFEPGELENLARSARREIPRRTAWPALDVYLEAAEACREEADPWARAIARQLDRMHGRAVASLAGPEGLARLRADLERAADLSDVADLASHLWALATSGRAGAEELCDQVGCLVSITALRLVAFASEGQRRPVRQEA